MHWQEILASYRENGILSRDQLLELLTNPDPALDEGLRQEADRVRQEWVGDAVHIRGIIEFSNYCIRNCHYCGINRHNQGIARYRMTPEEIVDTAHKAVHMGVRTIVLQSGEDFNYTGPVLAEVVREIKRYDVAITLSVGERSFADYQLWREAGADRYLLKFETSSPELYRRLHPGCSLRSRLRKLEELRELGYQLGSGMMIGLPGQTPEILVDDILLMRALNLEMAGVGPFIPHPGTPLKDASAGSFTLSLRVLALTRLMLPWAHLPATTALASINSAGRQLGLKSGANVLMPNLTPLQYRRLYEIYPQKAEVLDTPEYLYQSVKDLITSLGRQPAQDHGHGLLHRHS